MKQIIFTILLLQTFFLSAQNANRKYESCQNKDGILNIKCNDGSYFIKMYDAQIVETTFVPNGEILNPNSHAVILKPKTENTFLKDSSKMLEFYTSGIVVKVQKSPFKIAYFYKNNPILSEKNGYVKKDSTETLDFNIDTTEALFGGGSRALGMNRRGNRLQLYNQANGFYGSRAPLLNFTMSLVLSSKLYAVHFDNAPIGYLDLDSQKNNTLTYETISGRKTYQVIVGNSWTNLISNYTNLTGKQPLPARWTLGNFASRFGYHNQEDAESVISKFQQDSIPVDAIILDLYWFGKNIKGTLGNLDWDKDNFPEPTKMISDFSKKGIKTVLITEPFILTTSKNWQDAVDKKILATDKLGNPNTFNFYFGNTGIIDVFKPEAQEWFWNVYKRIINQGVSGLWGDLGEPEMHPANLVHVAGTANEVHNIYGHTWAKLIAEGYKKDFPKIRPFILMRSGYSGSQRFGIIPWSGDVARSWGGLQAQPEIALQMGMQGIGYMNSDLGGFAGDYNDNELYVRWLQYGVFQPIYRPHSHEVVASEPVRKDILTEAKVKTQIELRYQMLPYNYSLAFENNQKGIPLMRPLFFEEPQNQKLTNSCDSYLWGNEFLVTPITEAGITEKNIYFPVNNNWFDFYTNQKHQGGTTEKVAVVADHLPIFVRGGAFVPMIKTIQNTTQYSLSKFDLHYYFDEKTSSSIAKIYNDDGQTANAFENGAFEILNCKSQILGKICNLKIDTEVGTNFQSESKTITLKIHNCKSKPKKVLINEKNAIFSLSKNQLEIVVLIKDGHSSDINIQF